MLDSLFTRRNRHLDAQQFLHDGFQQMRGIGKKEKVTCPIIGMDVFDFVSHS